MAVKIFGMATSACTRRVLMTCHELGVEYQVNAVNLYNREHKKPDFLENMHPLGATPVFIDEDGTKLFESRAIARYLVAKYGKGSTLVPPPSDLKAYGLFEQAASIEYSSYDPAISGIYLEHVFSRIEGRELNTALIGKLHQTLLTKFEGYERILSKQKYLAGDVFTLADLFHIQFGKEVEVYFPDIFDSQPSVKRWWADITARESWKAVVDHK